MGLISRVSSRTYSILEKIKYKMIRRFLPKLRQIATPPASKYINTSRPFSTTNFNLKSNNQKSDHEKRLEQEFIERNLNKGQGLFSVNRRRQPDGTILTQEEYYEQLMEKFKRRRKLVTQRNRAFNLRNKPAYLKQITEKKQSLKFQRKEKQKKLEKLREIKEKIELEKKKEQERAGSGKK